MTERERTSSKLDWIERKLDSIEESLDFIVNYLKSIKRTQGNILGDMTNLIDILDKESLKEFQQRYDSTRKE